METYSFQISELFTGGLCTTFEFYGQCSVSYIYLSHVGNTSNVNVFNNLFSLPLMAVMRRFQFNFVWDMYIWDIHCHLLPAAHDFQPPNSSASASEPFQPQWHPTTERYLRHVHARVQANCCKSYRRATTAAPGQVAYSRRAWVKVEDLVTENNCCDFWRWRRGHLQFSSAESVHSKADQRSC